MNGILGFAVMVGLLTLTPGLDTALILRTSLISGRRPAWGVVAGIQAGTLSWGVVAAVGLSTLLAASQVAYEILRWAGVAYLVWMGVRMLLLRGSSSSVEAQEGGFLVGFRRGLTTNLLNPKVGAFYVAVLPQFIPADAPHAAMGLLLASVHVAEGLLWSAVLIAFTALVGNALRKPSVRRWLDRVTGMVIVGFGIRLAVQD
ncbi:LysE family translocator [Nonomuraea sp. NPDC050556]|uniref:LysE family translocator n=1 Tax=Nonomuraea sp. NPDC050556 TaxID=3364369 RepID=UPI0037AB3B77